MISTPPEPPRIHRIIRFAFLARFGFLLSTLVLANLIAGCGAGVFTHTLPTTSPTQGPPTPQQSGSVSISPQNAAVAPGQTIAFTAAIANGGSGTIQWQVNGVPGGSSSIGTIDASGHFTAPAIIPQSNNVVVTAALSSAPNTDFASATVAVIVAGQVAATANPQVASYSIYLPRGGNVEVHFGPDKNYGLNTWVQPTPSPNGGLVTILVAGMLGSTAYHMQAQTTLDNGVNFSDVDHTFTTGTPPITPPIQITTSGSQPPQPGVEMFDTVQFSTARYNPSLSEAFATDLKGNVLWTYQFVYVPQNIVFAIKPLINGHFLLSIGLSPSPPGTPIPAGAVNSLREVDLVGNTIHELTMDSLNLSLAANGFTGVNLISFSHDVLALPNGHFVILATTSKSFTNLTGYPGTTNVSGDVLVDLDQNYKPDWVWNTFDHLDINRHPFSFPPFWTIGNALAYSADDNNLLFSLRDQNWIIKIDFQNGQGSGKILWHLGEGGDFKLLNGTDPTDWFYAQHGMSYFSPNTAGVFKLGVMDNGDDRAFPPGVTCGSAGQPVCKYSTVPVFQIDESAMTATLVSHYIAPANLYSFFGGQTDLLANGDTEADFCSAVAGATVQEFLPGTGTSATPPQIVWQAFTPGYDQYRATRLPSLYPGVQW